MTESLHLRVWNDGQSAVPVVFSGPHAACIVELRCLPGASGVHIALFDAQAVRLRAEVAADPGEVVPLQIERDEQGALHVSSRGRNVLLLPVTPQFEPPPPIQPLGADAPLDLAIVVDGTLRSWADKNPCLLDHRERWTAHADQLIDFAARIADGRDFRAAVIAFGDQESPAVKAQDLYPRYRLHPPEEDRSLRPLDAERLRERLLTIPSSPGGDYVDALAEALDACVRLRWRPNARKVVVLTGDSPGSSLVHMLPRGADLCVRRLDVDSQALWLHRQGVEVITIYHAPPAERGFHKLAPQDELLRATRAQYARLASVPELAFESAAFDAERAAERFARIAGPIGRGAALGLPISSPG